MSKPKNYAVNLTVEEMTVLDKMLTTEHEEYANHMERYTLLGDPDKALEMAKHREKLRNIRSAIRHVLAPASGYEREMERRAADK